MFYNRLKSCYALHNRNLVPKNKIKKRILSLILAVMMVSSMLSVMTFTASAETSTITRTGSKEIEKAIDKMKPGDTLDITDTEVYFDDDDNGRIDIGESKDGITLNFYNVDFVNTDSNPCTDSFIEINADNVTMNFDYCNFQTKIGAAGEEQGEIVVTQKGSAIYVDGANCVLNGHNGTLFNGCGTKAKYGGAIYVDDDDNQIGCRIIGFSFRNCYLANAYRYHDNWDDSHGACIYVAAKECSIVNCYFETDNWHVGPLYAARCVTSKTGDTIILGGDPNDYQVQGRAGQKPRPATRYGNCKIMTPEDIPEGEYVITTALDGNKALDINCSGSGGGYEDCANLHIYNADEAWAKNFFVTKNDSNDGSYTIKSKRSGKVLDVADGSAEKGKTVFQFGYHGGNNQRWCFVPVGDGTYYIFNVLGTCMDVAGSSTANDADVATWFFHDGTNQKFKLNKVSDSTAATGSTLSQGNIWIIVAVAVVVIVGVAALVIVKKKKRPVLADGVAVENEDNE